MTLGFAWWMLDPLLYMSVYYVLFGIILQGSIPHYRPTC